MGLGGAAGPAGRGGTATVNGRTCWWARCPTLRSGVGCCVNRWNNRSWPTPSTRSRCKLGGSRKDWRFDRMATVVHPGTGAVTATYAQIAKHFGVRVRPCPPRRGNRKGVVEKANHTAAQRWWRSLPDEVTAAQAQASLDEFCATIADQRRRTDAAGNRCTVADLAAAEPLRPVPKDPPIAVTTVNRKVSAQGLVSFRGNTYSVPPAHAGQQMSVTHRLGAAVLTITTTQRGHRRRAPPAARRRRRLRPGRPARHRVEHRRPIGVHHRRAAPLQTADPTRPGRPTKPPAILRGDTPAAQTGSVVDLTRYAEAAARRRTLPPTDPTPVAKERHS